MNTNSIAAVLDTVLDEVLEPLLSAPAWVVGFSGGRDSTVLLHLLARWCDARDAHCNAPRLSALHVNHSLQDAAASWEAHCSSLCESWGVGFKCLRVTVPDQASPEAAAREARYAAFQDELDTQGNGAVLFLAHHLDDQIETFFLRLMRGAGVEGLSAMPANRPLGSGTISRPLLGVPAHDIAAYASELSLAFVEDPSNVDTHIDRNFLRNDVLPLLESRWPAYRHTVERAVAHVARARDELEGSLATINAQASVMGDQGIAVAHLQEAAGAQLLRRWLRERDLPAPDQSAINEFLRQLREGDPNSRALLVCASYVLQRYRDAVFLLPPPATSLETANLLPGQTLALHGGDSVSLIPAPTKGFWLKDDESVQIHWRAPKQRFALVGRQGSRTLKSLYQDLGVPPWWRGRIPLVSYGEELLQIGELATCDSSRWREQPLQEEPQERLWQLRWHRA
ncbi:MAG: tRNA lysidine(34) synthetase TilS [Halioglobus sp.]